MKLSIIIPSRPKADTSFIKNQLKNIDFSNYQVEFLFAEGTFPPLQRNSAIKKTSGDFVYLFDDDIIIPEDVIVKTISYFDHQKVAAVGGPNLTPESDSIFARLSGEILSSYFGTAKASARWKKGKVNFDASEKELHGSFLCFRGQIIRKYLFPEDMFPNDENELINRIRNDGYRLYYIPDCFVYHKRRANLKSHLYQVYISGRGRAELIRRRGLRGNQFYLIPPIFLLYLIATPLLSAYSRLMLLPLILYFMLAVCFSMAVCIRKKSPYFVLMAPLVFASHITYALGFLKGLVILKKYTKKLLSVETLLRHHL